MSFKTTLILPSVLQVLSSCLLSPSTTPVSAVDVFISLCSAGIVSWWLLKNLEFLTRLLAFHKHHSQRHLSVTVFIILLVNHIKRNCGVFVVIL